MDHNKHSENRMIDEPLSQDELSEVTNIDLLFFAYRDFTAGADKALEHLGFGRAHHRALYFINRRPGMMVAELLDILNITKQSLGRVLRQLISNGYIVQQSGAHDRRQRLLFPTTKGRALILELSSPQSDRINKAVEAAGDHGNEAVPRFMSAMIDSTGHKHLNNLKPETTNPKK